MIVRSLCILLFVLAVAPAAAQEVVVIGGLEDAIEWLKAEQWWGATQHGEHLTVPNAIMTGISPVWRETAQKIPVTEKKEIFYRFMLPLVLHANTMVPGWVSLCVASSATASEVSSPSRAASARVQSSP